jgi:hypothetical protein
VALEAAGTGGARANYFLRGREEHGWWRHWEAVGMGGARVGAGLRHHTDFFHDGDTPDGRQGGLTLIFFHGT